MTYEEWTKIIDINHGPGRCCAIKAVAPVMKRQGSGRIVNIRRSRGSGRPPRRSPTLPSQGGVDPSHQVHGRGSGARGAGELPSRRACSGACNFSTTGPGGETGRRLSLLSTRAATRDDCAIRSSADVSHQHHDRPDVGDRPSRDVSVDLPPPQPLGRRIIEAAPPACALAPHLAGHVGAQARRRSGRVAW